MCSDSLERKRDSALAVNSSERSTVWISSNSGSTDATASPSKVPVSTNVVSGSAWQRNSTSVGSIEKLTAPITLRHLEGAQPCRHTAASSQVHHSSGSGSVPCAPGAEAAQQQRVAPGHSSPLGKQHLRRDRRHAIWTQPTKTARSDP